MARRITVPSALVVVVLAALSSSALAATGPTPQEQQWAIASHRAIKLNVRKTGWYRVNRADLQRSGLPAGAPARTLQLFADGREVSIRVTGARKGRLGPNGVVRFYGVANQSPSTDTRTYWLVWGQKAGKRIPVERRVVRRRGAASSFTSTAKVAPTDRYWHLSTDEKDESDHFYGPTVLPGEPASISINVPDPAAGGRPVLAVRLQGYSEFRHQVQISLNGQQVGTAGWGTTQSTIATLPISRDLLKAGVNTVSLEAKGGPLDFSLLDWVSITYSRLYRAEANQLVFKLGARRTARVAGFSQPQVKIVDITVPRRPRIVPVTFRHGASGYTAIVRAAPKARKLAAFATRFTRRPDSVVRDSRSTLFKESQGADMVIISYPGFISALAPLVQLREQQGLRVRVVNVQQVYDEFGYGAHGPDAIKAFLARTREAWKPVPRFVLLVGDATVDPRNYLGLPDEDYVPTKMVKTFYMRAPSDDWFADFNEDGVPEMAVGRFPVASAASTAAIVAKIVRHETVARSGGPRALLVADANRGFDFEGGITGLSSLLPSTVAPELLMRSQSPSDADFRATVEAKLSSGPDVVAYVGHGSVDRWGVGNFLLPATASALGNENPSIYVVTSCLNGYFVDPPRESLGEDLLENPGGAVAMWASSALADAQADLDLNRALFARLYDGGTATLGMKIIEAKRAVTDGDVRRGTVLLGDPATRIE